VIHDVPLTTDEEVTLRRVAYGQSEVRDMRRHDLARLRELLLIEDSNDGPRLTIGGKQRFDILPKAASLDRSSSLDDMLEMIGQRLHVARQVVGGLTWLRDGAPSEERAARSHLRLKTRGQAMTEWSNYDVDGKRVLPDSKHALFRAKEVPVETGVPAPPGHASPARVEYRDVHAIDQPDLRKTFESFSRMRAWFKEHATPPSSAPSSPRCGPRRSSRPPGAAEELIARDDRRM
jgi:hypothetical protein